MDLRDRIKRTRRHLVRMTAGRRTQARRDRALASWAERRPAGSKGILIVAERHMPYPNAPYFYAEWLDWCAEHEPDLRALIRVARIPAKLPADTAVLHAWVQDPVRERDPRLFHRLEALESHARAMGARVLQPAAVLSNSLREVQADRLTAAGIRTPRLARIDAGFARELGGLGLPLVVRKSRGHGAGMERLDTQADVERFLSEHAGRLDDWVATEYIDVQSPDGYFRKYRYVLFGERAVCRHVIFSPRWEVRPDDRVMTDETIAEELEFLAQPCVRLEELDRARRALEFDIAAFDLSFTPDGEMVVWEVNPYPELGTPVGKPAEILRDSIERTYETLAAFYRDELAAAIADEPTG